MEKQDGVVVSGRRRLRISTVTRHRWLQVLTGVILSTIVGRCGAECSKSSPLVGFWADLSMLQHQLRGRIEILDDCTFQVSNFDMLSGNQVYWWATLGEDVLQMLGGRPAASHPLVGRFSGNSFQVTLMNGTTWGDMSVLSVWSMETISDYGHVVLEPYDDSPPLRPPPPPPLFPSPPPTLLGPAAGPSADSPSSSPAPAPAPRDMSPAAGPSLGQPPPTPPPPVSLRGAPQPTVFEACASLVAGKMRVRWTLDVAKGIVDIGVEGAFDISQYLAFGWAKPGGDDIMLYSDVAIMGYNNKGMPFADDYFITDYKVCQLDEVKPTGVCPDWAVHSDSNQEHKNNVQLLHAQRIDGITLVRYQRPLQATDPDRDHTVNATADMQVVWAVGPYAWDTKLHHIVPQQHSLAEGVGYGYRTLNLVSPPVDECVGPLSNAIPDTGDLVVAEPANPVVFQLGQPTHYPNPPNSSQVFFVNGKETPTLKVERGVPVKFSVQGGFNFPLYITSDPVGGHTNASETVYWGGQEAYGVPVAPYIGTWRPNRTTPDVLYYQSYSEPRMGWKIQVVDSSLTDVYPFSAPLADGKVKLHWSLSEGNEISFAASGEWAQGWLAIAFGSGMKNSWAYVAYMEDGMPKLGTYWMDDRNAASIHETGEELKSSMVTFQDNMITFHFTRDLHPANCKKCKIINPQVPLQVVWAYGNEWSSGPLQPSMMHSRHSSTMTRIDLRTGNSTVEHPGSVFAVHGFMMFLAWGMLMPAGVLAARYLKQVLTNPNNHWFQIHLYTQVTGIAIMCLGLLFAIGELQGFSLRTNHAKVGITAITFALWQPLNAYLRPHKPPIGERPKLPRMVWQNVHTWSGRVTVLLGTFGMLTGLIELGKREEGVQTEGLFWGLSGWFVFMAIIVFANEYRLRHLDRSWRDNPPISNGQEWTNGTSSIAGDEEEATSALLPASREAFFSRALTPEAAAMESQRTRALARGMEIQLEPMR